MSKIGSSNVDKGNFLNSSIANARIKRKKLNNPRLVGANNVYTEYLMKEVKGL